MPRPPRPIPGLLWRSAELDDAEALQRLDTACREIDGGYGMAAAEYREELTHPANDPEVDTVVALDPEGEVAAFGAVFMTGGDRSKHRAFPWGHVRPDYRRRGVGTALQSWLDERAAERLAAFEDGLDRVIRVSAYEHQADRRRLFERFGYEPARHFAEMIRPLTTPFPPVPRLGGIEIYGWSDLTREAARSVHNQAFADHWGSEPVSEEGWEHRFDEFFLAEASSVAFDGDVPVAYLTAAVYPHDFEAAGRRLGWIEGLGTVASHRRRGIATVLILEAMARFVDRGLDDAALGVDSESPTGAIGLYERLGFRAERRSITYAKWLDPTL